MSALIDARNKINECLLDNYNAGFKWIRTRSVWQLNDKVIKNQSTYFYQIIKKITSKDSFVGIVSRYSRKNRSNI